MATDNDTYSMSAIFDRVNHREISDILSLGFKKSYLLELLQIILLHSLQNNNGNLIIKQL